MATSHVIGPPEPPALWSLDSARFHMLLLLLSITFSNGLIRGSIGPLIVCMITRAKQFALDSSEANQSKLSWRELLFNNDIYGTSLSIKQQSYIHSSYYYGGIFGVFVSYLLMRRLGTKRTLGFGLLINTLASVAMPVLAVTVPYYSILFLRPIMGIGNGFVLPCSVAIIRKWFPSEENVVVIVALFAGNYIGTAASLLITPLLSDINIFGGWTIAMVLYGFVGFSTATIWEVRAAGKPRHSNYVTATELDYLRSRRMRKAMFNKSELQTPFKKIIFSPCVIAACFSCYTYSFIMSSSLAYLPIFNYHILRMRPISNGIASALPFLIYAVGILIFYTLSLLLKWRSISTTATIRIFYCIGTFGLSLCLYVLVITSTTQIVLLTLIQGIGLGFLSIMTVACILCSTSVAPQFTVFIFSYTEVYAQLAGIFSPVIVEALLIKDASMQWQILICLLVLLILTGLNFLFFAHGEREIVVERRVGLSLRRHNTHAEASGQEEPISASPSELPAETRNVTAFVEGEAMFSARNEELPIDELESLTSDDEY